MGTSVGPWTIRSGTTQPQAHSLPPERRFTLSTIPDTIDAMSIRFIFLTKLLQAQFLKCQSTYDSTFMFLTTLTQSQGITCLFDL